LFKPNFNTLIMKKTFLLLAATLSIGIYSCGGDNKTTEQTDAEKKASVEANKMPDAPANDPNRGIGKFTHVDVGPLDASMAGKGKGVYEVKFASCHKTTDEKLVGPGWKGVTERYAPEWIMNFMTNTDEMLNKDPKAQAQLEICLVRMPNQNLSDDDARSLLEFMRQNDGAK
jgi:cytochrome c551/c552